MEWLRMLVNAISGKGAVQSAPAHPTTAAGALQSEPEKAAQKESEASRHARAKAPVPMSEASEIVHQICAEALSAKRDRHDRVNLRNSRRWIALQSEPPERQAAAAMVALRGIRHDHTVG